MRLAIRFTGTARPDTEHNRRLSSHWHRIPHSDFVDIFGYSIYRHLFDGTLAAKSTQAIDYKFLQVIGLTDMSDQSEDAATTPDEANMRLTASASKPALLLLASLPLP